MEMGCAVIWSYTHACSPVTSWFVTAEKNPFFTVIHYSFVFVTMQVLLGDSLNFGTYATAPSKEGLKTVLQVLKIQQQFWPVLGPAYASLQARQGSVFSKYS
jgi:hypothetical protein